METVPALALHESEELHRITLSNMSDAVFITDDDGRFTFICPNVDVIFGYGQHEVRTMTGIADLLGPELVDLTQLRELGEVRNLEREIVTKYGGHRTLLVHVKQVSIKGGTTLIVCRDITERRRAELARRSNEERLTLALEAANMGTWDWHIDSGEMAWSPQTHRILGDAAGTRAPSFDTFLDLVHPTERERVALTMSEAMDGGTSYETEFRIVGYDNVERWVMGRGKALRNGRPMRMLGVFVDVTERHRTQSELRELSERLINGHERERRRLARELHDGIAQRLSMLSMEARLLDRDLAGTADAVRARYADLATEIAALGNELHRVSYELHPARLEQLGLEAAIRTFCAQISQTHRVDISVQVGYVPPALDPEIALCIYRVTQEALHNVVRHSGAAAATIALGVVAGELRLRVADDGDGFDPTEAFHTDSLGLTSMRERVRLIGGNLVIEATPGAGTVIEANVILSGDGEA